MSLVGPISSVVVTGVVVLFYIMSTATNYWVARLTSGSISYYGLWELCTGQGFEVRPCGPLPDSKVAGYMEAARDLMLTAVIVAWISWIIALVALLGKGTGQTQYSLLKYFTKRFWTFNGLIFSATGLLVLIGTSVYADETKKDCIEDDSGCLFGYSIIIAWVSIPLSVVAAAMLTYFFRAMCDDANSISATVM